MIRARNLRRSYGGTRAVADASVTLLANEVLVVLGPSGSGKTSLLRLIAGLERPDGGTVEIDEEVVSSPARAVPPHRRRLGMIFQDLALWPHMSVRENVLFGLLGNGMDRRQARHRAEAMLRQVALADKMSRLPRQLSGGELQRLALARSLAPAPAYLLMDEPFGSLDPALKGEMTLLLLEARRERGLGVLYVTHNLDEALSLGDRIAVMKEGRLGDSVSRGEAPFETREALLEWYLACVRS